MLPVRFYLDYIDPGSFVMDRRVAELEEPGEVAVERLPWEVRRPPEPLLEADDPVWSAYWEEMAGLAREAGFDLVRPELVPWTRKAHELGLLAREKGCFDSVHRALMDSFHLEGRDLGRVDVLVGLGQGCGLDRTETKAALDVDRYSDELDRLRREAVAAGVRGVPTVVRGEQVLEGIHEVDTLREFLHREQTSEGKD